MLVGWGNANIGNIESDGNKLGISNNESKNPGQAFNNMDSY